MLHHASIKHKLSHQPRYGHSHKSKHKAYKKSHGQVRQTNAELQESLRDVTDLVTRS